MVATGPFFVTLPEITSFTIGEIRTGAIGASANQNPITSVVIEYNTSGDFTGGDPGTQTTTLTRTGSATPDTNEFTDAAFKAELTGLAAGTKYYARAVVKNSDAAETYGGGDSSNTLEFIVGATISVYAWHDADRDGLENNSETYAV